MDCVHILSCLVLYFHLLSVHILFVVSQAPSYHLLFEAVLIVCIIRLFFMKSYKPERTVLTEKVRFPLDCSPALLLHLSCIFYSRYSGAC